MSHHLLIYPLFPAILAGIVNWIYWKRKGYTAATQLVMGILIFYAVFYGILKLYYEWTS
jgi:hypothetical protein